MSEEHEELVKWLGEESAVSLVQLCRNAVRRAAGRLQAEARLDHVAMAKDLRSACLLLRLAKDSADEEKNDAALELLQLVCLPYLNMMFQDCTAHDVAMIAETMATLLQMPDLAPAIAVAVLRDGVVPLLAGADSADQLASLSSLLCGVFSRCPPCTLHSVPGCSDQLSAIFPLLLSLLSQAPATTCHHLLSSLLPLFITPSHPHYLTAVWTMVQEVWHGRRLVELHPLIFSLAVLCCFADVLIARDSTSPFLGQFPSEVSDLCPLLDVRSEGVLWAVLEAGLHSCDPLDRKRSLYLLDRVLVSVREGGEVVSEGGVFWWRKESEDLLNAAWQDLVLLLHTMEEKQIHIVKPVKSRLNSIARASSTFVDGLGLLHVCWLKLALERIFVHTEAKSIVRWGVSEALSLDLASSPLLHPSHWQFVYGPVLTALSDSKLYARDQHASPTDLCPPMATLITSFLQRFLSHLPSPLLRGQFMHGFLEAVETVNLSEASLVHISHSLSLLPPSPLLKPPSLLVIRFIMGRQGTITPLLRAAIMTFLLTTAANLSDLSEESVGWSAVAMLLNALSIKECLAYSSSTWCKVCEWVREVNAVSAVSLSSFLTDSISSLLDPHQEGAGPGHVSLAVLLLISLDTDLSEVPLDQLLLPVTSVLSSAASRPYLPPHTLTLSLLTLSSLITTFLSYQEPGYREHSVVGQTIYKSLLPWLPDIIQTLQELLLKGWREGVAISLPHLTLLTSSLSSLHTFTTLYGFLWSDGISPTHLASTALCTLHSELTTTDTQLTSTVLGALTALGWVCKKNFDLSPLTLTSLCSLPLTLSLARPTTACPDESGASRMEWGPAMEWCEAIRWSTIRYCLRRCYCGDLINGGCKMKAGQVWEVCRESVDTVASSQLPCLLDCLSLLVPEVEVSEVLHTVKLCWRSVGSCLSALTSFLGLLLHPDLLHSPHPDTVEVIDQLCEEVLVIGERRRGVVNILADQLCGVWGREWGREEGGERVTQSMLRHKSLILKLCMFGCVSRRSMRSLVDTERFVRLLGDQVAANCSSQSDQMGDGRVRVSILSFLVGVASRECCSHFLSQFAAAIFDKLSELSSSKPRYFINSLTHRLKQRLLQTLLLLVPHLPRQDDASLASKTLIALQRDNLTSVRHLLEWTSVLLLARHPQLIDSLLIPALAPDSGFRMARLPSLLAVVMHLSATGDKVAYCRTVLPVVFQWTACHHFVVRLYAQRTVELLWEVGREGGSLIDSCIPFLKMHSDAARFAHKLEQNVFFSLLKPLTDLSVEVIFNTLPRVCGMVEVECLSASHFSQAWKRFGDGGERVPLWCENSALCDVMRGGQQLLSHVMQDRGLVWTHSQLMSVEDGGGGGREEGEGEGRDVQKKITPWASGVGVLEELFPGLPASAHQPATAAGGRRLVVVASLLQKIPNLGGLCRTCEIFGVSELVVGNMSSVGDTQFTALSVSAQHWLKISEVHVPELPGYLRGMCGAGYQLVGAEQTAQSKCVTSYSFQPHTLLLLGNEREGIPVQLLHMLHECVQIPQLGMVRSLNAHVSGALLVWEYCKQHLLNSQ